MHLHIRMVVYEMFALHCSVFVSRILDLSFNRITHIAGLENLSKLEKLFLCDNKIQKIDNINHLQNLQYLELGSNKIRVSRKIILWLVF